MGNTTEVTVKFIGDKRQLAQVIAAVRGDLSGLSTSQVAAVRNASRQTVVETTKSEKARVAETIKAANQRLKEEQRAAKEVARIVAETARQADRQEKLRERAAKQLADVQIREAKRAAKELEKNLKKGGGGGFDLSSITNITGQIPALGGLTSQLSSVSAASASAGAATASMAGPIGIAVGLFLAEAAAVATVSKGLFDLAKSTADFQGKLFDMSQQVGVSVETLSALEVLAATTGGSIETVAASLAIFQKNLEASHDPTSKEAKLLQELGVTARDTEGALAETLLGLFKMGEGSRQTASALELFGRSGRFVLAILKEADGDLERAKQRFRELGILIGTDNARAADQFNDRLATLGFQLRGLTAEVGNQIIPTITNGLKMVQKIVADNKDGFEALGVAARGLTVLIGGPLVGSVQALGFIWKAHQPIIKLVAEMYERLAAAMQLVTDRVPDIQGNEIPAIDLSGEKSGIALLRKVMEAMKGQVKEDPLRGLKDFFDRNKGKKKEGADAGVELLQQLQQELRGLTERTREQQIGIQLLDDKFKGVNATVRQYLLDAAKAIDLKKAEIEEAKKHAAEVEKEKQKILQLKTALSDFEFQQIQTLRQLRFGDKTAVQEASEFVRLIEHAGLAVTDLTKFWLNFTAHLIDSNRQMKEMLELMRQTADAVPTPGGRVPEGQIVPIDLGVPPPPPDFSVWQETMAALKAQMVDFSDFIRSTFVESIFDISDALGQGIATWALYGGSFAKAMKQSLAALGAKIAAEAIMMAAIHAAYAIGSAAFGNWAAAAQHAIAAAKFAAIGGIAALATRALAGNDFQQGGGNAFQGASGAGGGTNASGGTAQRGQPTPVDLSRDSFVRVPPVINITISGEAAAAFDYKVERAVVQNINLNGEIRSVLRKEAA